MRFLLECGDFLRESRRHFRDTGALLPSSRFLAQALVSELKKRRNSSRILEVGPGTGSVTAQILRWLRPGDRLELVEVNSHFVSLLRRRFEEDRKFRRFRDQVRIIHAAVEQLPGREHYDYIVSGLPLNNFPVQQVREIYQIYSRLLRSGGTLSYYEYVWIRQLRAPFVDRRERRRLYRVGRLVGEYIRSYQVRRQRVLMNVPPAVVRHLRLKPGFGALVGSKERSKLVFPEEMH
jgi:phosphatidylethanolamine/phosphatidyl-N-methylethanolamine N-methyltransferase